MALGHSSVVDNAYAPVKLLYETTGHPILCHVVGSGEDEGQSDGNS